MPDRVLLNVSQRNSSKVLTHAASVMKDLSPNHKHEYGNKSARSLGTQSAMSGHHDSPNRLLLDKTSKIDPIIGYSNDQGEPTPRSPSVMYENYFLGFNII